MEPIKLAAHKKPPGADRVVAFDRIEIGRIMNIYSRYVATGLWRDYALDFTKDEARFSVFQHTAERPDYVIAKRPQDRHRQGAYRLIDRGGRILKRGDELWRLLDDLERRSRKSR